jgi:hypothetical protein
VPVRLKTGYFGIHVPTCIKIKIQSPFSPSDCEKETSYYAPSVASISKQARSISEKTNLSGSSSRLTDFFGAEVFQIVLNNPTTCPQLTKFAQTHFCGENMEFLDQVCIQHSLVNRGDMAD